MKLLLPLPLLGRNIAGVVLTWACFCSSTLRAFLSALQLFFLTTFVNY